MRPKRKELNKKELKELKKIYEYLEEHYIK